MKKIIGIFILLINVLTFSREITLEEAIDLSLANSKEIEKASKNKVIGKLNLNRAFKLALPVLVYSGSYIKTEHTKKDIYIGKDTIINNPSILKYPSKSSYKNKIILTWPIFQGGAILGGIKGAKAQNNILTYSYIKEKTKLRLKVIKLYSNILIKKKKLETLKISKLQLSSEYEKQKEKFKLDLVIKADLLKTEYALLNVETEILREENEIFVDNKKLKLELGIDSEEEVRLKEILVPNKLSENMDLKKDMEIAKEFSLVALISKNNLEYKKAEAMVAFSENLPKINLFGEYGGIEKKEFSDTLKNEEWRGGVQLNWEFFSFGSGLDKFKISKKNSEIEELDNSIVQDNIEINLIKAHSEVIRLENLRKATGNLLKAAEENYSIDKERYKLGLISIQDFLSSEVQFREAKINYNKAERDYFIAFEEYRTLLI